MKRTILLSLLAFTSIATQAQPQEETRNRIMRAESVAPISEIIRESKTKKTTVEWHSTENNSWHEDIGILDKVPVTDLQDAFPSTYLATPPEGMGWTSIGWQLADEGDNTVLHCYLRMPADIVTNLWLGGTESVILDKETGIIYQAQSTVPARCYNKVFGVKGKKDTALDLQIIFPRLPDTARKLAIYGVPAWRMQGMDIEFSDQTPIEQYDIAPLFHMPRIVKESVNYNKDNLDSWAVYTDAHFIKPVTENTMAIWRTPDATYLAIATEQNWLREYYGRGDKTILLDQQGHQYKCKEVMGYPKGDIFWLDGYPGDHFAIVLVFEPLPLDVTTFNYIDPEGEPFSAWGADWSGDAITDLDVQQLRNNQHLFEYHPRVVVK